MFTDEPQLCLRFLCGTCDIMADIKFNRRFLADEELISWMLAVQSAGLTP